jgi:hypothetical protein
MITDTDLISFKAISKFTDELAQLFGKKQRSLKLYNHLIHKTTLSHQESVQKHISAFKTFCIANRDAILNKNKSVLKESKVSYSTRVYIDIESILNEADEDTQEIIWKHILVISALVDPISKAKSVLKNEKESDFLMNIITKVENSVDVDNSDPMQTVSNILTSGVFTDLVSNMNKGLEDGSLDIGKLMTSVQNMVGNLNPEGSFNPVSMITSMLGNTNL